MSDPTQGSSTAPDADEVGDGGANIAQQPGDDTLSDGEDKRKSVERQADGEFPIMS